MKPGREIDALVAEKVMGWRKEPIEPGSSDIWYVDDKQNIMHRVGYWCPSISISCAWEVFEKIKEKFAEIRLKKNFGYCCEILIWKTENIGYDIIAQADAETAPLAICLAALKALGVEVE